MIVKIKDIQNSDYMLSAFGFDSVILNAKMSALKEKYSNLVDLLDTFTGFAFDSSLMFDKKTENLIPLVQINNVNEKEYLITEDQKFVYVPNIYKKGQSRFLIRKDSVLVSLTGGDDKKKDISSYFIPSFECFLNQRVISYSLKKDVPEDLLYYFYAFSLSDMFKEQMMGNGGIQKNTGKKEIESLYIPLITDNNIITYIATLTKAIIQKEKMLKSKYNKIMTMIEEELDTNSNKSSNMNFINTINDIKRYEYRLDTSVYSNKVKEQENKIANYKYGSSNVYELGFKFIRGNNLAVSIIGQSIYSDDYVQGFYPLILAKNISRYGTLVKTEYLGNKSKLLKLKKGSVIFGAEGTFRSTLFLSDKESITNFHGLSVYHLKGDIKKAIVLKLMLDYFRETEFIPLLAAGGNGGSLSIKYWDLIKFPNFPEDFETQIAKEYHNDIEYNHNLASIENFIIYDNEYNNNAGILELDNSIKYFRELLDKAINNVINQETVEILF